MRDRIAVIDVETTGIEPGRHHRVVEIGVVITDPNGGVIAEYETLINPCRDVGACKIHGITATDVARAPTFDQIAGDLIDLFETATIIAGHNISFDQRFLTAEFERLGADFPRIPALCTYRIIGRTLAASCKEAGIPFNESAHRAIHDARATARLVPYVLDLNPDALERHRISKLAWPKLTKRCTPPLIREAAASQQSTPPVFLQRLASRLQHDVDANSAEQLTYLSVLDRILEDRLIDEEEQGILERTAIELSVSNAQLKQLHTQYLQNLAVLALADGDISPFERRDLHAVARLLGQDVQVLDATLEAASRQLAGAANPPSATATDNLRGNRVCFTGELNSTIGGEQISREMAIALAERAGLISVSGVSKKLDLLVVADPNTQSSKARKARDYGIRIVADAVFWRMLNVAID